MFRRLKNFAWIPKNEREGSADWLQPFSMLLLVVLIGWVAVGLIFGGGGVTIAPGDGGVTPGNQAPVIIGGSPTTTTTPTSDTTVPGSTPGTDDPGPTTPVDPDGERDPAELAQTAGLAVFTGDWEGVPTRPGVAPQPTDSVWPDAEVRSVELVYQDGSTRTYNVSVDPDGGGPEAARILVVTLDLLDGIWLYAG